MYHIYSPLSYTFTFHLTSGSFRREVNTERQKFCVPLTKSFSTPFSRDPFSLLCFLKCLQSLCDCAPHKLQQLTVSYMGCILQLNVLVRVNSELTLRLLMSYICVYIYIYIYGAPSKARNANVVYIWTYVWQS